MTTGQFIAGVVSVTGLSIAAFVTRAYKKSTTERAIATIEANAVAKMITDANAILTSLKIKAAPAFIDHTINITTRQVDKTSWTAALRAKQVEKEGTLAKTAYVYKETRLCEIKIEALKELEKWVQMRFDLIISAYKDMDVMAVEAVEEQMDEEALE